VKSTITQGRAVNNFDASKRGRYWKRKGIETDAIHQGRSQKVLIQAKEKERVWKQVQLIKKDKKKSFD